jgi:hypothetical protein
VQASERKRAKGKGVRTTVLGDEGADESKDIDDEEEDEEIESSRRTPRRLQRAMRRPGACWRRTRAGPAPL